MSKYRTWPELGDPIVLDGHKYRIRVVGHNPANDMPVLDLAKTPARKPAFQFHSTSLEWDSHVGVWRGSGSLAELPA